MTRYPAEPDVLQVVRCRGQNRCSEIDVASELHCSAGEAYHVLQRMANKGKVRRELVFDADSTVNDWAAI